MKTPVTFMLRIRFTCSELLLKAVKGNKQEACGCSLFLNFLLCQRKVTVNVTVFCHSGCLFFVSHNLIKTWKWVLRRSTLMPLTDVGGHVRVQHGRVAQQLAFVYWPPCGRHPAGATQRAVLCGLWSNKQPLTSRKEVAAVSILRVHKDGVRNVSQPPLMLLLKGFGLSVFGFGRLISVCHDISINNVSDNYAS